MPSRTFDQCTRRHLARAIESLEPRRLLAAEMSFDLADFSGSAPGDLLMLNGDARLAGGTLEITDDFRYDVGSAYTKDVLDVTPGTNFSTHFTFRMTGALGTSGGDGIVFVLQGNSADFLYPSAGGALGYAGVYPSVAIEFDTDQSTGDPDSNHVAVHLDGDVNNAIASSSIGLDLNSGALRHAWIDYSADLKELRVFVSGDAARPASPVLSTSLDLYGVIGEYFFGEPAPAHVGFSGANGWDYNRQRIHAWSFTGGESSRDNRPPTARGDSLTALENGIRVGLDPRVNDSDPDGDSLVVTAVGNAGHGATQTNGSFVYYTPNPSYAGPDSFTYTVSDGHGGTATATVDVLVQPSAAEGKFSIELGSYTTGEGVGYVDVYLVRSGDATNTATIEYLTSDATAKAGQDYQGRSGVLTFQPGEVRKAVRVTILDDSTIEGSEYFAFSLDAASGATLGAPRTSLITIEDNDRDTPTGQLVPWLESFDVADGTDLDLGGTAWTIDTSAVPAGRTFAFNVANQRFVASDTVNTATWLSAEIDIASFADGVTFSGFVQSGGNLESSGQWLDAMAVYLVVDGVDQPVFASNGNFNGDLPLLISKAAITGETLQIRVEANTTSSSELFWWDNFEVRPFEPGGNDGDGDGLKGEYFDEKGFANLAMTRVDSMLDFNWAGNAPDAAMGKDNFSVRWTGSIVAERSETYTFYATADDGIRVYVDGELVVDDYSNHAARTRSGAIAMTAGRAVNIVVEYFETGGQASARLEWSSPGTPRQIIPTQALYSTPVDDGGDDNGGDDRQFSAVTLVNIGQGIAQPTDLAFGPNDPVDRVFVAQKDGEIRVYQNGQVLDTSFVDMRDQVNFTRDRGLLGITLHPSFPAEPYLYAFFTYDPPEAATGTGLAARDQRGNRPSRLVRLTADPATNYNTAVPGRELVLLGTNSTWNHISSPDKDSTGDAAISPSGIIEHDDGTVDYIDDYLAVDSQSHGGGDVEFGPDGMLYVSTGDGTSYGIVDERSKWVQDVNTLRGKILRIDPETGLGLPDNPHFTGDGFDNASRVWASGLRNPFHFAVDPISGDLFVGDVGWYAYEEINRIPTAGNASDGGNYGWPWYEGGENGNTKQPGYEALPEAQAAYNSGFGDIAVPPLYARSHADGARAFLGGDFLTGDTWPEHLRNQFTFVDFNNGFIEALILNPDGSVARTERLFDGLGEVTALRMGYDGDLWYTDLSGKLGKITFA